MKNKQFYITTPLYYSNAEPHIGHAYTTILADVLSRHFKRKGFDVHFLTGLDEHGQKVATEAEKSGLTPQEHCDQMAVKWINAWEKLGIEYDDFIRTTESRHTSVVIDVLNQLNKQGDIYQQEYEGWYSVFEERFFTEKDLIDGKDPIGNRPVERLTEINYFFRMSKYQDWLIDHYKKNPQSVIPEFRLNEVMGFLRQPLNDLCISRPKSRLSWGIPIPWDDDYVTYVWFDALLNYYSATVNSPPNKEVNWPAQYHLIAKDILTTHAVYWPIMLHAAGLELPECILTHGYWLSKEGVKMSKSIGNVTNPLLVAEKFDADALRYVLMREMSIGYDAYYNGDTIINCINNDLANDLGNLYSRLSTLWKNGKYDAQMPPIVCDNESLSEIRKAIREKVDSAFLQLKPNVAIDATMQLVRGLNQFIEQLRPWEKIRSHPEEVRDPLAWCLDSLYEVADCLLPIMPEKMALLKSWIKDESGLINPKSGEILFPRIVIEEKKESKQDIPQSTKTNEASASKKISIDDFKNVEMLVGEVKSAEKHPSADKLLVLKVQIGDSQRQIVAGIANSYDKESLIGKYVVVVTNLPQVKLRGVVSEGMILAAGNGDQIRLVTVESPVESGWKIS